MSTLPQASTFDDFGGVKLDYGGPPVTPSVDRSAAEVNGCFASVASGSRTSVRAYCQFTGVSSGNPTVSLHNAHWGSTLSVIPTVVRNSTGNYTVTWPASVTDPLGVVQAVNFQTAIANLEGTVFGFVNATQATPNTVTILTASSAGSLSDLTASPIQVWVI